MDSFSQFVIVALSSVPLFWRLAVLFFFSFAEGLPIIGSILPGGTIAILAGSLSTEGLIRPITAVALIAGSSFLGDMTGFLLGKRFRNLPWIQKIITHEKHQRSWDLFDRHIALIAIFGKLIPVVRSTPSLFAAARGVWTRRYIIYSALGSALWGFTGVYAGNLFSRYFGDRAIPFILGILVCTVVVLVLRSVFVKIRKNKRT